MRVWDISPSLLCDKHLLGEHREIHAIWNIITQNKKGYSKHPEVLRWKDSIFYLNDRHNFIVFELYKRGFKHKSDLIISFNDYIVRSKPPNLITPISEQIKLLNSKPCKCNIKEI